MLEEGFSIYVCAEACRISTKIGGNINVLINSKS
jgi:hypothetical protein